MFWTVCYEILRLLRNHFLSSEIVLSIFCHFRTRPVLSKLFEVQHCLADTLLLPEFCQYKSSSIISQYRCTPLIRSKTKRVLSKLSSLYSYPWNNLLLSLLCLYSDLVPFLLIRSMFRINLPIFEDPCFWYRAFRHINMCLGFWTELRQKTCTFFHYLSHETSLNTSSIT